MFPLLPTLRRQVSRPVAAGVSLSQKDVAASLYVCSRGADNASSIYFMIFPSGVIFALRITGRVMDDVESIKGPRSQKHKVA